MRINITPHEALALAVELSGTQSALADLCEVGQPCVWKWLQSSKRLPAEYVLRVEKASGLDRHYLRPDIYPLEGRGPMPLPDHPAIANWQIQTNQAGLLADDHHPDQLAIEDRAA